MQTDSGQVAAMLPGFSESLNLHAQISDPQFRGDGTLRIDVSPVHSHDFVAMHYNRVRSGRQSFPFRGIFEEIDSQSGGKSRRSLTE